VRHACPEPWHLHHWQEAVRLREIWVRAEDGDLGLRSWIKRVRRKQRRRSLMPGLTLKLTRCFQARVTELVDLMREARKTLLAASRW
jgi:hypothetical protein